MQEKKNISMPSVLLYLYFLFVAFLVFFTVSTLFASPKLFISISPDISEFTLRGSISKIWGHRPSYYYFEDELANKSNSGGSPFNSAVQADFKWKLSAGTLESGVKVTYRRNDIYHEFYTMENGNWTYSDDFSKDLLHQE